MPHPIPLVSPALTAARDRIASDLKKHEDALADALRDVFRAIENYNAVASEYNVSIEMAIGMADRLRIVIESNTGNLAVAGADDDELYQCLEYLIRYSSALTGAKTMALPEVNPFEEMLNDFGVTGSAALRALALAASHREAK